MSDATAPELGSRESRMNIHKHDPPKKKVAPFHEFDKMVREKYGISEDMYNKMSNDQRNEHLRAMLEKETIVIFPTKADKSIDGMPNFAIIFTDLKEMATDKAKK